MNVQELHIGFMLAVDKIASNVSGNILPEEVDFYLNMANVAVAREAWDQRDLQTYRPLHVVAPVDLAPSTSWPGASFGVAPADMMLVSSRHVVTYPTFGPYQGTFGPEELLLETLPTAINAFPMTRKPIVMLAGTQVVVSPCPDSPAVKASQVSVSYLRKPTSISLAGGVSSELPDHVHQKIVERAVSLALTDLKIVRPANDTPAAS